MQIQWLQLLFSFQKVKIWSQMEEKCYIGWDPSIKILSVQQKRATSRLPKLRSSSALLGTAGMKTSPELCVRSKHTLTYICTMPEIWRSQSLKHCISRALFFSQRIGAETPPPFPQLTLFHHPLPTSEHYPLPPPPIHLQAPPILKNIEPSIILWCKVICMEFVNKKVSKIDPLQPAKIDPLPSNNSSLRNQ